MLAMIDTFYFNAIAAIPVCFELKSDSELMHIADGSPVEF